MLRSRTLATRPGTERSLADERVERSIFRSSRYIRVLFASFVASYPFFIPPFVSRDRVDVTAFARSLITDLLLTADRHQFISQYGESSRYMSGKARERVNMETVLPQRARSDRQPRRVPSTRPCSTSLRGSVESPLVSLLTL